MEKYLNILKDQWLKEKVSLLPSLSKDQIISYFSTAGIFPSDDLIALYITIGGFDGMDSSCLSIWSIDRINENIKAKTEFGFEFSDFLLDSFRYSLHTQHNTSKIYVLTGSKSFLIANSLTEFLKNYIEKPFEALHNFQEI